MSSFTLLRLLAALAVGGLLVYSFYHTDRLERREEPGRERRYAPYGNPWLLPAFLAVLTAAAAPTRRCVWRHTRSSGTRRASPTAA